MTVSYVLFLRAQQRRHDMPVHDRTFTSSADMLAAGKAARARLMGVVAAVSFVPAVAAPLEIAEPVEAEVSIGQVGEPPATLNMIAPCSAKFLLSVVAMRHGVSAAEIVSTSRNRKFVAARTDAMCMLYEHTQWSIPQVARFLRRDHTTVVHALQKCGVTGKRVDCKPHNASAYRPKRKPRLLVERQKRDVMHVARSRGFDAADNLTALQIVSEVCAAHGVSEYEMRGSRRAEHLVIARHEAMYRMAKELALTNREIGKAMGGKDPSLVHYAIKAHEARQTAEAMR